MPYSSRDKNFLRDKSRRYGQRAHDDDMGVYNTICLHRAQEALKELELDDFIRGYSRMKSSKAEVSGVMPVYQVPKHPATIARGVGAVVEPEDTTTVWSTDWSTPREFHFQSNNWVSFNWHPVIAVATLGLLVLSWLV